jgi:hypothetical protein
MICHTCMLGLANHTQVQMLRGAERRSREASSLGDCFGQKNTTLALT